MCLRQVRVLTQRCAASEELRLSSERQADAYRHSLSASDGRSDASEAETARVRTTLARERWAKLGALVRARHETALATKKAQAELRAAAEAKAAAEAASRSAAAAELRRTSSAAAALGTASAGAQRALRKRGAAAAGGKGARVGSVPTTVGADKERGGAIKGERGGAAEWETSSWVPVIDVFSSAALSESEGALMRRVIAARVAPGPSISYTRRPL
jgi:hypothetical protein